jgi:hypothetical protein
MKPIYDRWIDKWTVNGIGTFDSKAEALFAINQAQLSAKLLIQINPKDKEKLVELAEKRNMTISELVRSLIRKEIASE